MSNKVIRFLLALNELNYLSAETSAKVQPPTNTTRHFLFESEDEAEVELGPDWSSFCSSSKLGPGSMSSTSLQACHPRGLKHCWTSLKSRNFEEYHKTHKPTFFPFYASFFLKWNSPSGVRIPHTWLTMVRNRCGRMQSLWCLSGPRDLRWELASCAEQRSLRKIPPSKAN